MPTLSFKCSNCGHTQDHNVKFGMRKPDKCRKCGGKLEQKLTAPHVQFRGTGWTK